MTFLAVAGTAALAGCTDQRQPGDSRDDDGSVGGIQPTITLDMQPVTDIEIARKTSNSIDDYAGDDEVTRLVDALVTNGSVTATAEYKPLGNLTPLYHNGNIYRTTLDETEEEDYEYVYKVELTPVEGAMSPADVIALNELPAVDRTQDPLMEEDTGRAELRYTPAEQQQSELVPTLKHQVIEYTSGTRVRITINIRRRVTTQTTYRYSAERIASVDSYGERIRTEHVLTLSNLSDAERDIVDTAITDKYEYADHDEEPEASPTDAQRRLVERFHAHRDNKVGKDGRGISNSTVTGFYIVRYDGQIYWVYLHIDEEEFGY